MTRPPAARQTPAGKRARVPRPTTPEPEECSQAPPCVLPEELVRSTMLRIEHALQWGNWAMVLRVVRDARQSYHGLVEDSLRPIEQRPIEALATLGGLPNALVYALRTCRGPRRPLVTVQDLLDQGPLDLANRPGLTYQRVQHVWQAIEHARAAIERDSRHLLCWQIVAR